MRIGLVSDTHMPDVAQELPTQVAEAFRGVDLILHAGDIYIPSVLDELERIAPVLAARGDDDYGDIVQDKRVQERHVLKLKGQVLWLVHERPALIQWRKSVLALGQDESEVPDIVVYGHQHITSIERRDGVLFVTPGSPTFLNYTRGKGTVGILNIDSSEAQAAILWL